MALRYAPLYSGSSGNCVYIGNDDTHILLDAGMAGRAIESALAEIGVDPHSLNAILVTHEHSDHIKGVGVLSRKYNLPIYATEGTWGGMDGKIGPIENRNIYMFDTGIDFYIGSIDIMPFETPHDSAASCGYAFESVGARFALATDIGCVRDSWLKYVLGANAVLLESNYDAKMLEAGPYPYDLKRRIASKYGHLSNDDCARTAVRLIKGGTTQLTLGHLSKENNFPELALQTTTAALELAGIKIGDDVDLRIAKREGVTGMFEIGGYYA